jgi:hypothetical protein
MQLSKSDLSHFWIWRVHLSTSNIPNPWWQSQLPLLPLQVRLRETIMTKCHSIHELHVELLRRRAASFLPTNLLNPSRSKRRLGLPRVTEYTVLKNCEGFSDNQWNSFQKQIWSSNRKDSSVEFIRVAHTKVTPCSAMFWDLWTSWADISFWINSKQFEQNDEM